MVLHSLLWLCQPPTLPSLSCWFWYTLRNHNTSKHQQHANAHGGVMQVWGVKGYVDFYLPEPLCTALELTRDSDRWQEHLQRFEPPAGKYYPMIACGAVKHWAVVDFLSPPKQQQPQPQSAPPEQHAQLYSVRMLSWDSAEIWHMGKLVQRVDLAGTTDDAHNTAMWEALRIAVQQAQGDQPPLPMED